MVLQRVKQLIRAPLESDETQEESMILDEGKQEVFEDFLEEEVLCDYLDE